MTGNRNPDEEKVTYSYNVGGLLEKVRGEKSYGYDYITKLGYDKFEQRSYLKYCNGAETFYTYDNRRRLSNLAVNSGGTSIMDNAYTFDAVSNVLSVANNAALPANGKAGGQMSHTYTYDGLYRLATATGTYTGADSKSASYTLAMGYDNMHRITSKRQHLTQDNVQFGGTLNVGYDLTYAYSSEDGKKFQLESIKDVNYRTELAPEGQQVENGHGYTYDRNGNLVYVNTSRMMTDGHNDSTVGERKLIWDEENRLLAVDDNGLACAHFRLRSAMFKRSLTLHSLARKVVSNYWYDADGERTVKTSGESDQVYVNGVFSGGMTNTAKFSLYVSPYLVANQGGRYTKHIYAGTQRIVSKVGDFASYGSDPRRIEYAGANTDGLSVDYKAKYAAQQQVIKDNCKFFDVPYNGTDNDNYADGEGFFASKATKVDDCCNDGSMEAAQAQARKAQSRAVARSFKDPDNYENLQFFYHPDHLGSSSFITNLEGEVVQHIEYVPFGEVFIEERNNVWNTPYLFNAKEFDEETGLYYYGARYYDPRLSLWISSDPMSIFSSGHSSYQYCKNNPINLIDPTGLFETKQEAEKWAKSHNIKTGFLRQHKIKKQDDCWAIVNERQGYQYQRDNSLSSYGNVVGLGEDGVLQSTVVYANKRSAFSYYASDVWNSSVARNIVPDFYSVGVGFTASGGISTTSSFELTWVLHGPEASLWPIVSATQCIGGGGPSADVTFNKGSGNYIGSADDIRRSMVETNSFGENTGLGIYGSAAFELGGKLGLTESLSIGVDPNSKERQYIIMTQINIGLGLAPAIGASGGTFNTFILHDFAK